MIQLRGFLGRVLGPSLKTGLPLMKNVIKSLGKSVLITLGSTATASAADSMALRCGSFLKKILTKSPSAVMIRIIITFANQISP